MTKNLSAHPLQTIIAQANKVIPTETGITKRLAQDFNARELVILCDVSSSMAERVGDRTKAELCQDALDQLPFGARLIAFGSHAQNTEDRKLPAPRGSTNLTQAVKVAINLRPIRTILISDGQPDNQETAFAARDLLSGTIDTIYVGPESDAVAMAFMDRFRRGGNAFLCDLSKSQSYCLLRQQLLRIAGRTQ